MYSYFHLYNPEGVHTDKKCDCGCCDCYPELFHAVPYRFDPYPGRIETLERAKSLQKLRPDAVIVEHLTTGHNGFTSNMYINHNTGKTWKYNGHRWTSN